MNFNIFLTLIAAIATFATGGVAAASTKTCELEDVADNYYRIMIRDSNDAGNGARMPTIKQVFDAMNNEGSTLFEDQIRDETVRPWQEWVLLSLVVPKKSPGPFWLKSLPQPTKGDPKCGATAKKMTGYECRIVNFRKDPTLHGVPEGLNTSVLVKIPRTEVETALRTGKALGCDKTVLPDGKPLTVNGQMDSPVQLAPSNGGNTTR